MPPSILDTSSLLGDDQSFVPDTADVPTAPDPGLLPLSTTTLLYTSASRSSMLRIHRLHNVKSRSSSYTASDAQTHEDATRNFHELAVLARARWQLRAHPALPFHLAALEVMREALDVAGSPLE
jgi:mediator of RNA polymerase II transcription subunit 13, fungi type